MILRFERHLDATRCVRLYTKNCSACWKCIETCPKKLIGRVNLPWHKHARFRDVEACTGCLKCVRVCKSGALLRNLQPAG